jgi:transcriptional regulator with XRE-family HTH domain
MDAKTIGRRITVIRKHRRISQVELAAAIGVSKYVQFHYEHGDSRMPLVAAVRIAMALHCTLADLLAPPDAPMPRARVRRQRHQTRLNGTSEIDRKPTDAPAHASERSPMVR